MTSRQPQNASERLYLKYEHLVKHYASKLFHIQRIGMEKDDIEQEFKLKLYQVILAYGRSLDNFNETGTKKPVPLIFYIKQSLSNHVRDFIKDIESEKSKLFPTSVLIEDHDYATFSKDMSDINFDKYILTVNGFDMLANLDGLEKRAFWLYCKGLSTKKLKKVFKKTNLDVEKAVNDQIGYLRANLSEFSLENKQEIFVSNFVEE